MSPKWLKPKYMVGGLHPGVLRNKNTRWKCSYPSRASPRPNITINQEGEQGASKCFVASFLFWCHSLTYVMPFLLEVYLAMVEKVVAVMAKVISGAVDRNVGLRVAGISACQRAGDRGITACRWPCCVVVPVALAYLRYGSVGVQGVPWCGRVLVSSVRSHASGLHMASASAC